MLLRYGSVGEPVRNVQGALNMLPPSRFEPLKTDGIFGKNTHVRVVEFQGQNDLAPDGLVGPLTLNMINGLVTTVTTTVKQFDPFDRNYRLPERKKIRIAVVYLRSWGYDGSIAKANIDAANNLLDSYNLELDVWPKNGSMGTQNTDNNPKYELEIQHTGDAYRALRDDMDARWHNVIPDYRYRALILFCAFAYSAKGATPYSTKKGVYPPFCLLKKSAGTVADNLTILHELGHAVQHPVWRHDHDEGHIMTVKTPRSYIFRHLIEAFARSWITAKA